MKFLTAQTVVVIHDSVISPNELPGVAPHRSIEAVIARVENRMAYGLIGDVFDLAACYAAYIAVAHAFNDANKRTAFAAMDTLLALNGIELSYNAKEAGDMAVKVALGQADEADLAEWLRALAR